MAAIRSRDTAPEVALRSALHRRRVRFRLGQFIVVAGRRIRPDLVFKRARVAVFVDGCFWHGCKLHCRMPTSNREYWQSKISRNCERDTRTDELLRGDGWTVVRAWEHDSIDEVCERVLTGLGRGSV